MANVPRNEETMIKFICNACPKYTECMQNGKLGVFSVGDEKRCFEICKDVNARNVQFHLTSALIMSTTARTDLQECKE